jgi:hypothetical protein
VDLVEQALRAIVAGEAVPENFLPFNYSSNGAEVQHLVKAGASYLFGVTATNANAAGRFLQIFDTDKAATNGAVPIVSVSLAAAGDKQLLWVPPRRMDRGIVVAASTTQNTLTLAAAEHLFDVQYV